MSSVVEGVDATRRGVDPVLETVRRTRQCGRDLTTRRRRSRRRSIDRSERLDITDGHRTADRSARSDRVAVVGAHVRRRLSERRTDGTDLVDQTDRGRWAISPVVVTTRRPAWRAVGLGDSFDERSGVNFFAGSRPTRLAGSSSPAPPRVRRRRRTAACEHHSLGFETLPSATIWPVVTAIDHDRRCAAPTGDLFAPGRRRRAACRRHVGEAPQPQRHAGVGRGQRSIVVDDPRQPALHRTPTPLVRWRENLDAESAYRADQIHLVGNVIDRHAHRRDVDDLKGDRDSVAQAANRWNHCERWPVHHCTHSSSDVSTIGEILTAALITSA